MLDTNLVVHWSCVVKKSSLLQWSDNEEIIGAGEGGDDEQMTDLM